MCFKSVKITEKNSFATLKVLFLGDVVAKSGIAALRRALSVLKEELQPNIVVVNGENSSGGIGIDLGCAQNLFNYGADIITLGDHAFHKRDFAKVFNKFPNSVLRPANFPLGAKGQGWGVIDIPTNEYGLLKVGVVNLIGRVFMNNSSRCPFDRMRELLDGVLSDCTVIIVDFHAEATSEKLAFANYFDGLITTIVGTHTHVQTSDARVLPYGTGYITDLGMCGPTDSVIGLQAERAIKRFITCMPANYKPSSKGIQVSGVLAEIEVNIDLNIAKTTRMLSFSRDVKV